MDFVYLLIPNRAEWEDIVVLLTEEDAINESMAFPGRRVEIFKKSLIGVGYVPTHNYYKRGEYIKTK